MTQNAKSLAELGLTALGGADARVTGIAIDSRKVDPGTLFAALPGTQVHGARFIEGAIADGAVAILTDREGADRGPTRWRMPMSRSSSPRMPAPRSPMPPRSGSVRARNRGRRHRHQRQDLSVASFTRQIWERLGHRAVNIGTTGVEGSYSAPGIHTTPDP
jgi:UDP-N-acetylmuramoyl-L-alanyl-D-glutamate--2,6-diaminopimelate ligase